VSSDVSASAEVKVGWSRGTEHMTAIIRSLREHVPDAVARKFVYRDVLKSFQDADWDAEHECLGLDAAFDAALKDSFKQLGIDL
jgi:hypothetical protein